MSNIIDITEELEGGRLDRLLKKQFPQLSHGAIQKMLRTGQIRINGKRIKGSIRLEKGQSLRIPPRTSEEEVPKKKAIYLTQKEKQLLKDLMLYEDKDMIVLDKPSGLATQGGSKTLQHVDRLMEGMIDENGIKPKLVHRLDKNTSGLLLLAKTDKMATYLARAFQEKKIEKTYWAITIGVPKPLEGEIDLPLLKKRGDIGEQMVVDHKDGKKAITRYRVIDHAHKKAAWLEMVPLTGRTHQLRAHCQAMGTPVQGDRKYGRRKDFLKGDDISELMHLHARTLKVPMPSGKIMSFQSPLPDHMKQTFKALGFKETDAKETKP
ncbi:MAG: RluA family pseudouridine synthase [Alphaproteobacteria bacterium]|nr:RluA family pseudouridine synthase [Alphaproteobacteria bacterium]MBT5389813.1 RluA family pseudouridine synthase [Alphaproteobacteria bacterium]MBT5540225.1 RluA family pseudouridine synthase [Alphaproteobacteria bacterium]